MAFMRPPPTGGAWLLGAACRRFADVNAISVPGSGSGCSQPFTVQQRHAVVYGDRPILARHLVARHPIDGFLIDAVAGILHRYFHPVALIFHCDHHCPFALAGLDAVRWRFSTNGWISRLRNAHRDVVVDVVNHRQLGAETRLFDGDAILDLMKFLADIDQFVFSSRL